MSNPNAQEVRIMLQPHFRDRTDAGHKLAAEMGHLAREEDLVVLALPRGGVPVAHVVAHALDAPLDVFLVRKLGLPGHEELAMGAIASGGIRVINDQVLRMRVVDERTFDAVAAREQDELDRRERMYRGDRPRLDIEGKAVALIDDGLATGSTMRAAVLALREHQPRKVVVGVPVAAPETCHFFRDAVDEVICAVTPEPFYAVGLWYEDFAQTTDEEVERLLAESPQPLHS
jgi:putative phosphoribosyl transferase